MFSNALFLMKQFSMNFKHATSPKSLAKVRTLDNFDVFGEFTLKIVPTTFFCSFHYCKCIFHGLFHLSLLGSYINIIVNFSSRYKMKIFQRSRWPADTFRYSSYPKASLVGFLLKNFKGKKYSF